MLEFYWICLIGGVLFAAVTLVFDNVLGDLIDGFFAGLAMDHLDFFQPMVLVGGITVFGGAGIMLTRLTALKTLPAALVALMIAVIVSVLVYFSYVKPMKNSENSTSFSIQELVGKLAEVTIPIPAAGYGEVVVKVGASSTNQIAASLDAVEIPVGERVVVVETREGILYVFRFENE